MGIGSGSTLSLRASPFPKPQGLKEKMDAHSLYAIGAFIKRLSKTPEWNYFCYPWPRRNQLFRHLPNSRSEFAANGLTRTEQTV